MTEIIVQNLDEAVLTKHRLKIGSALANFGKPHGGIDLCLDRDQTQTELASFE